MFFRTPRFIRRWIRRKMHPMAPKDAGMTRQKLAFLYMFIAWNGGGYVLYQIYKGNAYWAVTHGVATKEELELNRPAYHYAKSLGIKEAEVYSFGGGGGVKKSYTINFEGAPNTSTPSNSEQEQSTE